MSGGWSRDARGWPTEWWGIYPNELQARIGLFACEAAVDILACSGEAYVLHCPPVMRPKANGKYVVLAIVKHKDNDDAARKHVSKIAQFEAAMMAEFSKYDGEINIERF